METKNNANDDKFREELRKAITEAFNVHGEKLEKALRVFMEKHKAMLFKENGFCARGYIVPNDRELAKIEIKGWDENLED